jgi:hypothetical protein
MALLCPACITSTAIVVGGVTSGGGVFAYIVARIHRMTGSRRKSLKKEVKEKKL